MTECSWDYLIRWWASTLKECAVNGADTPAWLAERFFALDKEIARRYRTGRLNGRCTCEGCTFGPDAIEWEDREPF